MKKDLNSYKEKLQTEKNTIISELAQIGVKKGVKNPDDWQATPSDIDVLKADSNEVADRIESYEGNNAILQDLEAQLATIDKALERIENNSYGVCEVCGKEIEEDRLGANAAAATCKEHMNG